MSSVLSFFKEHPQQLDETHRILSKIAGYEAQLLPIRAAMLQCCGAEKSKSGKVELVVIDTKRWDALAVQQISIIDRLQKISAMVAELDQIITEIEASGIEVGDKTLAGICREEGAYRTPVIDPDTRTNYDRFGRKIPEKQDPRFLSWMQRAEIAMRDL
jgi:hypothetical protein